jgi:RimJ/RimL family protein N-acetyltransferase
MIEADLECFFEQQTDPTAIHMAAFTSKDPLDWEAYLARWTRILADDSCVTRTILCDGEVAGQVLCFEQFGETEVSYWIGREQWGKGIATRALGEFLLEVTDRPLFARAAADNVASVRVLEKCGFTIAGHERSYANGRGEEIDEVILRLDA